MTSKCCNRDIVIVDVDVDGAHYVCSKCGLPVEPAITTQREEDE